MADAAKTQERRKISMAEVAKHSTEEDCWLVLHGLVLDLKKDFLDEHPGGPDVITCLAGKDATQDFEDISHSDAARDWSNKHVVGYLDSLEGEEAEKAKTKLIPKMSELSSNGGGGGGGGMASLLPAIAVVIAAVIAFFVFKK
eukprot:TRINITY_DN1601_c0_g1_i1.p1 TRINITY_DN1601_c0_g1~~TRINITY_DN1601_c0_g1_i1.p1  ORF type:complete len:143 (+),score=42.94 TRINITY_DN1601_c0_g1_i1:97-525(+)